jgi:cell division transport system permease protein
MKKRRVFKVQTISVYISTTLVLLLLGIMGVLFIGAQSLSRNVKENILVTVVFNNSVEEDDILKIKKGIDSDKRILRSSYISKEQALAEETKALKANPAEILGYNPYEASLELTMKPEFSTSDELEKLKQMLVTKKGIKEIIYQKDLVDTINSNIQRVGILLLTLLAMLTLVAWSLIGNLVRLSIYSKRFIINTMQLVGAKNSFIRRPFIKRSFANSIIASILALLMLGGSIYFVQTQIGSAINLYQLEIIVPVVAIVFIISIIINYIATVAAVNRYLRMRTEQLYFI